ncbi:hypothetical protein CO610_08740 [Lysobacteraceae bacterium NML95-0200]|nr:hypothetical protein CO610_08740 [Xanthomonadaceae bacterium NML95-0200]
MPVSPCLPGGRGNQSWRYTPDGLPATITTHNSHGGNTVTNSYSYNKRRLLVQETTTADASNPWTLGYGYNANGHLNSHSYPAGLTAHYTLNALGQVTQISAQDGSSVNVASNISYFPNGAVKGFTYGNGITHTATQNTRGLPQRITDCTTPGTCNSANRRLDLQYSYDRNGNTTAITDHSSGGLQTRTMGYDAQDRLTQVTSSMFGTAKYSYDVLDNLTRVQVGASALHPARDHGYCYSHNRLSSIRASHCNGSLIEALTYDAQGNLASKGGQSYSFDYGNRLRSHGGNTQYLYDGHGRRVRYSATGSAPQLYSQYDYSGQLRWQRDEQAGQRIRHIYLGNRLIAEHRKPIGSNTVTIEYLHSDAQGSPLVRTNAARNAIETSQYEPYGRLVNRANNNRPGYTGHVQDSATGLTYMQQRYYDPQLGLFLSSDPVTAHAGDQRYFNRYWYAAGNPYKYTDSDGRALDIIADIGFIGYSAYKLATQPSWTNAVALGADVVAAAVPFATGLGAGVRAAAHGADAVKVGSNVTDIERGSGRASNKLTPSPEAVGSHTTFKRDADGRITNYATYRENPQNPTGFQVEKRVDVTGKAHTNPDGQKISTPHVKEGSNRYVRPAREDELPRRHDEIK